MRKTTEVATIAPSAAPTEQLVMAQPENDVGESGPTVLASEEAEDRNNTVKWIVGLALASILAVIAASFFIQRPKPAQHNENDPFAPLE